MLVKKELIALKIEATYKTDAAPTVTDDAILISNVQYSNEGARMVDRENIKATLGTDKPIFAGTLKKISFDAEIKGSGAAGTEPEISQALRACGMGVTIVASTSVTYGPVSENVESCTIYYYQDGSLRKLLGARGTVSINGEAGSIGKASFEFTGHDGGATDTALLSGTYDATVPVPLIGIGFSVGGYGAIINALTLDIANTIVTPPDMISANGFGEVMISERKPTGTLDPEMRAVGTKNFEAEWKLGTEFALDTGVIGSVAGNKYQITANIAYTEVAQGDRDGIRTNDLNFVAVETTGDDEFSIEFT